MSEIIPAMQMIGQGMAVIEINPRYVNDIPSSPERIDTLLEFLAEKFGAAPTTEFIISKVDEILSKSGVTKKPNFHLVKDQHRAEQPGLEASFDSTDISENARTDPNTEGVEPRGSKTCEPD